MENRITLTEVAYMFGVTEMTIRRWMAGETGFPPRDERGLFLERDVLEYAGRSARRISKIVRG